jgi:hypothetical protein
MLRFLRVLILPVLFCAAFSAASTKECTDKMQSCAKLNKCTKTPDSKECKACKTDYDKCAASDEAQRAAKKNKYRP